MYGLSYEPNNGLDYALWQEIIEDIVSEYAPLFSLMHEIARGLPLSRALIDDLRNRNEPPISCDQHQMWLGIDPIDDDIHGFRVYMVASEQLSLIEEIIKETTEDYGISTQQINAFEVESGLDMLSDVFEMLRDTYEVQPEIREGCVLFTLIIFDSQDIDNGARNDLLWADSGHTN